ncbi:MAG: zinc-ribbon domain-containing protein [Deltaproteobacteria bacterium]|nr:zinc-ribbon domain-containing protein [Deltaproteobacteria bacterium]
MIIQCEKCETSYRFDEALIDGAGVWVRCTRCQNTFFLENPVDEKIIFPAVPGDDELRVADGAGDERPKEIMAFEDIDEGDGHDGLTFVDEGVEPVPDVTGPFEEPIEEAMSEGSDETISDDETTDVDDVPPGEDEPDATAPSGKRAKVLGSLLVLLAVAFAAYLILYPQVRQDLYDRILASLPFEKRAVIDKTSVGTAAPQRAEIYFIDTKEQAINNWIAGDILVVEGFAVNKGDIPASKVKVRGRILDAAGAVLMEETSYGGTVLSEEELRNLTEEELHAELSNPWGRDFDNRNIPKDGRLPFTLVFVNPPENAQEYVIDLDSVSVGTNR